MDEGRGDAVQGGGGRLRGPDGERTMRGAGVGILVRVRGPRNMLRLLMKWEEVGIEVKVWKALHPGLHLK